MCKGPKISKNNLKKFLEDSYVLISYVLYSCHYKGNVRLAQVDMYRLSTGGRVNFRSLNSNLYSQSIFNLQFHGERADFTSMMSISTVYIHRKEKRWIPSCSTKILGKVYFLNYLKMYHRPKSKGENYNILKRKKIVLNL